MRLEKLVILDYLRQKLCRFCKMLVHALERGHKLMTQSKENIRAMLQAIENSDYAKIKSLISDDKSLLNTKFVLGTWLHVAAAENNIDLAEFLIGLGIKINEHGGSFDGNALNQAASNGNTEMVRYLLSKGLELETDDSVRNPLFGAITAGNREIAELLIDAGIDITICYTGKFVRNMDALAFAEEQGELEIADLIRAELAKQK
jgi:ankyrin repeat protein